MTNWLNDESTHRLLVQAAKGVGRYEMAFGNYMEAYQRTLDLNQDAAARQQAEHLRASWALELVELISNPPPYLGSTP